MEEVRLKNIIKNTYMGCCMAFRKEVLDAVLPIPKDVTMHDQWIGVKCDLKYHRTVFLKEPLILYRRHEKNVSDFSHNSVGVMIKNRLIFSKKDIKLSWIILTQKVFCYILVSIVLKK